MFIRLFNIRQREKETIDCIRYRDCSFGISRDSFVHGWIEQENVRDRMETNIVRALIIVPTNGMCGLSVLREC